ncbi:ubiquinol-cytochrome c reductase iron-sulfur subunit [Bacillus horti]|uniref:Menaquinol-cytochrome c reductase iron-sulfur subunit n=1 Tax=Caldalkalibacillus horti TaxID=77523 RepID=A0ABT9VWX1_9BACI|nr:ubiquinol-cytochrome c reductase iron-sulfur subunit [Bacillus horti]MDQ0165490.1 menaquinol-cytochrome c reductase iron-sulfur subunit [Bacillus horti]
MSDKDQGVSRRQFLNYTIMGVGGFLVAGTITPMLRFAIDPVLKADAASDMVAVGDISEFSSEPQRKDFTLPVVDGWAEYDMGLSAWISIDEAGEVLALSPICTHLGCAVTWEGNESHPNEYYCPCHDGRYTSDGVNIPGTPPTRPLDTYEYEVRDGVLYLGQPVQR